MKSKGWFVLSSALVAMIAGYGSLVGLGFADTSVDSVRTLVIKSAAIMLPAVLAAALSAWFRYESRLETVLATGRFGTDKAGYAAMRKHVASYPNRTWAVEGSNGAGRPLAQRLLADGEHVVDVPAKLSAPARLFDTVNAAPAISCSPHRRASASTGTSPADDTRFGSSNTTDIEHGV